MKTSKWLVAVFVAVVVGLATTVRGEVKREDLRAQFDRQLPSEDGFVSLSIENMARLMTRPQDEPDYVRLPFEGRHQFGTVEGIETDEDRYAMELKSFNIHRWACSVNWIVHDEYPKTVARCDHQDRMLTGFAIIIVRRYYHGS
jgi:hypothetical protein